MAGQHEAAFNRFGHHFSRTGGLQFFKIMVVHGAHDHRHRGCVAAHMRQNLQGTGSIQIRHHHRTGARQACGHQRLQTHRIAKHHRVARAGRLPHAIWVEVKRHVLDAFLLQHMAQILPAAAVTADDHMLVGVDGLARNLGHLQRLL